MLLLLFLLNIAHASEPQGMTPFIDHLMAKMTLAEKIGQLSQYTAEMSTTGASIRDDYRTEIEYGRVGSIFNAYTPQFTRQLQQIAMEKTRLKIPLLFAYDVVHGHRTIFPIPLGESASWDLGLMEKTARVAAAEASADGIHWTFAPMVDISRDPRWGRISEGAGEDPWLGSKVAAARVRGFQGEDLGDLSHVLACVKHFAAYGAPIGGRDYNSVLISPRELLEVYLPPYRAAVQAGVATLMPSFNDIDGVPSTANPALLQKTLRDQWKFNGFVVSDYTAINELVPHGVAADEKQAAMLAFNAGVDMDMQGGSYVKYLPQLIQEGKVSRAKVDQAVRRILEAKYKLGLFTDPYRFSNEERAKKVILSQENRAIARDAARKSIVMLKNDNGLLPLRKQGAIALIGPMADDHRNLIGNWSAAGDFANTVSLREGIAAAAGSQVEILHALGANLVDAGDLQNKLNREGAHIESDPRFDDELIAEAVKIAKRSDVVILALGEAQGMSGEAASRARIRLPENQQALLHALQEKAHKPIVLVLSNGRPLVLAEENATANAILETWFLGTESGHAIADVLFGDYNPSGRLTVSFPYSEGQIPVYYSARTTGRPFSKDVKYTSKYLDAPNEPLFPFGFGLSYTSFAYSAPVLSATKIKMGRTIKVKVHVTNNGTREGEETVQLYIRQMVASVSRPMKLLRGFRKVHLQGGESVDVELAVRTEDLKFYNRDMKWTAERGAFKVMVGPNSRDVQEAQFSLIK